MKKSLLVMSLLTIVINLKAGDWYLKSSGAVTLLSSWGTNPDGTGASPGSFSGANVWHFANRTGVTLTGNFSPPNTATASIENGFNLVVQTTFGQLNEKIDIPGNGTLTIANNKVYILNNLDVTSTVTYSSAASFTGIVQNANYGNLVIAANTTFSSNASNVWVYGVLTINSARTLSLNTQGLRLNGATALVAGTGSINSGSTAFIECYGGNGASNGTLNFTSGSTLDYLYIQFDNTTDYITLGSDITIDNFGIGTFNQAYGSIDLNGRKLTINPGADISFAAVSGDGYIMGSSTSSLVVEGLIGSYGGTSLFMDPSNNSMGLVQVNSPVTFDVGNPLNINNTLDVTGGATFNTNNNVTLVSTNTLKGRLADISNGTLSGNLTVQTFARGNTTDWANLGVSGIQSQTFNNWYGQIPMAIEGSTTGVTSVSNTYFESVQSWFESSDTYDTTLTVTSPIIPGKGYWVYLGTALNTTSDMVWSVSGTAVTGNTNIPITNSGAGWNLISNPYPSPIDWSNVMAVGGNSGLVNDAYYIYDAELGNTVSYVSGVATPASYQTMTNVIPMGQAFYVEAIGAGNLAVTEACKSDKNTNANELLKNSNANSSNNVSSVFRLNINGGGYHDDAVIRFHSNATNSFDKALDARKMYNSPGYVGYPGTWGKRTVIATQSNNEDYSINSLPYAQTQNAVIPVIARVYTTGQYTISGSDIQNLPPNACVTLKDKLLNVTQDLRLGNYICTINDTTIASRFELTVCADITADVKSNTAVQAANSIAINKDSQGIFVDFDFNKTTNANIIVTNVLGQIIMDTKKVKVTNDNIYLDINVNDQLIFVTVETDNEKVTKKFLNFR